MSILAKLLQVISFVLLRKHFKVREHLKGAQVLCDILIFLLFFSLFCFFFALFPSENAVREDWANQQRYIKVHSHHDATDVSTAVISNINLSQIFLKSHQAIRDQLVRLTATVKFHVLA